MVTNWIRNRLLEFLFPIEVIKIALEEGAILPSRAYANDVGWDLYVSSKLVIIGPGKFVDVSTGIRVQLPPEMWLRITGRSSTIREYNLIIQEGIIDTGYTGELFVGVINKNNVSVVLQKGDRIAQLIPHRSTRINWRKIPEVELISIDGRASSGFGSTNNRWKRETLVEVRGEKIK